jgi:hypothetical protein
MEIHTRAPVEDIACSPHATPRKRSPPISSVAFGASRGPIPLLEPRIRSPKVKPKSRISRALRRGSPDLAGIAGQNLLAPGLLMKGMVRDRCGAIFGNSVVDERLPPRRARRARARRGGGRPVCSGSMVCGRRRTKPPSGDWRNRGFQTWRAPSPLPRVGIKNEPRTQNGPARSREPSLSLKRITVSPR